VAKTILITGASGSVASATIALLQGSGNVVRALVRNPDNAEPLRASGAQIVVGDLEKPKTLGQAFAGADTVCIVAAAGPRAPEHSSNALWVARQAGVRHAVRLSAFGAAHDAPTINSRLHALSDSELVAGGITYTILKPHFFMHNLLMSAGTIKSDAAFYLPMGEGRMAMVDVRDIAEFAARVLTTAGHDNKTYTLTGPASITIHEVASALSEALSKRVTYVPASGREGSVSSRAISLPRSARELGQQCYELGSRWSWRVSCSRQVAVRPSVADIAETQRRIDHGLTRHTRRPLDRRQVCTKMCQRCFACPAFHCIRLRWRRCADGVIPQRVRCPSAGIRSAGPRLTVDHPTAPESRVDERPEADTRSNAGVQPLARALLRVLAHGRARDSRLQRHVRRCSRCPLEMAAW
jgi:uncharacterized protein YbjT (DUF2867 family)